MNMGLILFLSSLLLGTPSDKETENYSEQQQKIYYVFYEKGGTKMYPFSNTIYQDLVVSTSPREQDQAVKIWENIESSRAGARCSEDPLNHLP